MKRFFTLIVIIVLLSGCAGSIGLVNIDGHVDEVEATLIQAAVGAAMAAKPDSVAPAYAVSTAILSRLDGGTVLLSGLDAAVETEIGKLDLLPMEKASTMDLVAIVRTQIVRQLKAEGIADPESRMVVVRQVIEMVKQASAERLGVSAIDWSLVDREIDMALDDAVARTDMKFGVERYKARMRRLLEQGRMEFERSQQARDFKQSIDQRMAAIRSY